MANRLSAEHALAGERGTVPETTIGFARRAAVRTPTKISEAAASQAPIDVMRLRWRRIDKGRYARFLKPRHAHASTNEKRGFAGS